MPNQAKLLSAHRAMIDALKTVRDCPDASALLARTPISVDGGWMNVLGVVEAAIEQGEAAEVRTIFIGWRPHTREYRVWPDGLTAPMAEVCASYTEDPADALGTAKSMKDQMGYDRIHIGSRVPLALRRLAEAEGLTL